MNLDHITALITCPLCENGLERQADVTGKDTFLVHCASCGTFEITEDCMIFTDMEARLRQRASKLSAAVKKANAEGNKWPMINTRRL